jgi:glycosyltransferase involved in cell wall biosynthesis
MPLPLISVLMITYNHERFIEAAVNSVLSQQTDYPFELVIGEDHSPDATGKKVDQLAAAFPDIIKVVRAESNIGVAANFCRTFRACSGKYMAILDGDDVWTDPLKLQKQVSFMEANPDYGFVHGDVNHYYEDSGKTEPCVNKTGGVHVPDGNLFPELIKPQPLFIKTATVCFRKELASAFDLSLAERENWPLIDMPLWMDITQQTKSHYFDEVFATYRLLTESASRTQSPQKKLAYHQKLYAIKQLYFDKYKVEGANRKALDEAYYRGMIRIALMLESAMLSTEAIAFLKAHHHAISMKERMLVLAAKYKFFRKIYRLLK